MSFSRYPKYRDSGVKWLGDVPEHWATTQVRYVCECLDGQRVPLNASERSGRQGNIAYWGANGIVDHVDQALFDEDLVLLGEDGAPFFERNRPVAFFSQGKVWPNNHIHVLRPVASGSGKFITNALNVTDYAQFIDGSTRDKLTQGSMNAIPLPWPSPIEQACIVAFLDRESAKIDELIAEQQRLIGLLREKRQAVISHGVTKGLNPDAPMKPSGIEWLGDVPQHWEVKRLKHISPFITVGVVVNPSTFVADEGFPFIYGGDIREGVIDWKNARRIDAKSSEANSKTRLKAGDLLTVRVGAPGVTAVVPIECEGGNCASVMLIRQGSFNSHWLCYAMNTRIVRFQVEVVQYGAAQEQFNISHAVNFWAPTPPRAEQDKIAEFLADESTRFDALSAEAQRAIDLLQERRTALISAAVTGQIDVRAFAEKEAA
jgi:type I restriction enzyme S subunit